MSGGDLVDDRIKKDLGVEELRGGRRVLLDVAGVVVVGTVFFAGLENGGVLDHAWFKVIDGIVRDDVVDDDETIFVQGANGSFDVLWGKTRVLELGFRYGDRDGLGRGCDGRCEVRS